MSKKILRPGETRLRKLFGTDGIRGKANQWPMTCEMATALGRAVTHYFQKTKGPGHPLVVIGKDTRLSCYALEQAFSAGVCSQGGQAILTGPLPTPGVAFVTRSMRAQAGVMISASHNSFSDNGIKIFDSQGQKLPDQVEVELEQMVLNPSLVPQKVGEDLGRAKRLDESIGRYIVHVKSTFPDHLDLGGMRLVVDCAHGASYRVAPMIFSELGAEVIGVGVSPNGQNINEYVGSTYPEICAQKVVETRADMGICFDGDADRLVVISGDGKVIEGDQLIGMLARYLQSKNELGPESLVVGTVMSNLGLEHYLKKHKMKLARTQVGDRYIFDFMKGSSAVFGGEPSGHLIFRNYATTGDGLLAALKVIECMKFSKRDLSDLTNEIQLYPQVLKNIEVTTKPEFSTVQPIARAYDLASEKLGDQGRILLRYSGTEPKARVMLEGQDKALITEICDELGEVVQRELGP